MTTTDEGELHICAERTDFIGGGDWGLCCKSAEYGDLCYGFTPACKRFKHGRKISPMILYTTPGGKEMAREFTVKACWGRWVDLAKQTIAEGNTDVRIVDFDGSKHPRLLWHPEYERSES